MGRKSAGFRWLAGAVLLAVMVYGLHRDWRPAWLAEAANAAAYPVLMAGSYVAEIAGWPVRFIAGIRDSQQQIAALQRENEELRRQLDDYDSLMAENGRLRDLLQLQRTSRGMNTVAARIIARSWIDWHRYLTISVGQQAGISEGMAVITGRGAVGMVDAVYPFSSRVRLLTAEGSVVSVAVQRGGVRVNAVVVGQGSGQLRMINIPTESDVIRGDRVVTSGYSGNYPGNVAVGEVIDVRDDIGGLTRLAVVRPAVDMSSIGEVLVVKSFGGN
ncbi:MAG: rod shape-determining protein MreC [Negativicutes bacterium]|nr:rod shape-determining protein MreC [Negativicutes bacterium]